MKRQVCPITFTVGSWADWPTELSLLAGAFGAHPDHDAHLLPTCSAIQILTIHDAMDRVDVDRVTKCEYMRVHFITSSLRRPDIVILSLQQPSGVFAGDKYGEIDTRFTCCATIALSLLGRLHELDVEKTVDYIRRCKNFDGGFGAIIGAESHAAQGSMSWLTVRPVVGLIRRLQSSCALRRWRSSTDLT